MPLRKPIRWLSNWPAAFTHRHLRVYAPSHLKGIGRALGCGSGMLPLLCAVCVSVYVLMLRPPPGAGQKHIHNDSLHDKKLSSSSDRASGALPGGVEMPGLFSCEFALAY